MVVDEDNAMSPLRGYYYRIIVQGHGLIYESDKFDVLSELVLATCPLSHEEVVLRSAAWKTNVFSRSPIFHPPSRSAAVVYNGCQAF